MFGFSKLAIAGMTLGAGWLIVGCAANTKPAESTLVTTPDGVTCSKCEVTWVRYPVTGDKGRIVRYDTHKSMQCPDCQDAVTNFFATGKLEHTCKTCGDSMEICKSHG
jgi:hypothetical protein